MNTQEIKVELTNAAEVATEVSIPELIKGEKGDTPVKGVDYFTPEDIEELKKELEIPDLTPYALKSELPKAVSELQNDSGYLTEETEPQYTADKPQIALKSEIPSTLGLASQDYVNSKIDAIEVPTKTSELTNDSGFLTEHQSLEEYAKKANLATVATSGSYNDLTDKPEISTGASTATEVSFDDTVAQIGKTNVQEAIEYLADESVDSTSVQSQIETTFKDVALSRTDYIVFRNSVGNKLPAYITKVVEIIEAPSDFTTYFNTNLFYSFYNRIDLKYFDSSSKLFNYNNIAVLWSAPDKVYNFYDGYQGWHNFGFFKGHYYIFTISQEIQYKKKTGIDFDGLGVSGYPADNVSKILTTIVQKVGCYATTYTLGGANRDFTVSIYDITPYFQITQHEKDIAALKENSGAPDLSNYYTKEEIAAQGFLTEHQDISNLATKAELPKKVSELENDAAYLKPQDVAAVATSGSYNDLINKPTIPSTSGLASEEWVESKGYLTEHQDLTPYAKKTDLPTKVSQLTNDKGYLTAHQSLAGLATSAEVSNAVAAHNTASEAHSDIRELIAGLTTRLNSLADSDDTTLDQLSEIVAYIKANRELIESVTTDKVNVADIIDNLTTNAANKPLSAKQGVALKALIDAIVVPTKVSQLTNDSGYLTTHQSLVDYAKKTDLPTKTSDLTNDSGYLTQHQSLAAYAKTADLSTVATSGSYADLSNKPTIPSIEGLASEEYVDAANNVFIATFSVNEKTCDKTFIEIAAAYDSGKVCIGKYDTGPVGTIRTKTDMIIQFIFFTTTGFQNLTMLSNGTISINSSTYLPEITTADNGKVLSVKNGKWTTGVLPTKVSELTNDAGYLTEHQSLADYALKSEIPTAVSQLTNDKGYLTQHQDITGLVPKARKINGKALTADITLTAADVGATTKAYVDSLQPTMIIGTLAAGATSLELTSTAITTDSTFDFYTDTIGVAPTNAVVATGKITLTFEAQTAAVSVKVEVR